MTSSGDALDHVLFEVTKLKDRREYQAALDLCTEWIQHHPGCAELHYHRAQAKVLVDAKDPDLRGAVADAHRAAELNTDEPTYMFFAGLWLFELGECNQAAEDLGKAVALEEALDSEYYLESAHLLRALSFHELGDVKRAKEEVAKCRPDASFYARRRLWRASDI